MRMIPAYYAVRGETAALILIVSFGNAKTLSLIRFTVKKFVWSGECSAPCSPNGAKSLFGSAYAQLAISGLSA